MKEVICYESLDGKVFKTVKECQERYNYISKVREITDLMPEFPKDCDFFNGYGYLQWTKDHYNLVKSKAIKYANSINGCPYNNLESLSRILSDSGQSELYKIVYRLSCTDNYSREWGQIYFKDYPEHAIKIFAING